MLETTRPAHPALTPERKAELATLAEKIDRNEMHEIKAMGRSIRARHERAEALMSKIRKARFEKRLSLEDVSGKANITPAELERLETSRHPNPPLDTLLSIADAVGVDVLLCVQQS